MPLWNTLSAPWQAALEEAWAAYCAGSWPIGAVLVNRDGRIVARGRNAVYSKDAPHPFAATRLAHAELAALAAVQTQKRPAGLALYVTVEPCAMCVAAIRMTLMPRVCYACRDPFAGRARKLAGISVAGPESRLLEELLTVLMVVRSRTIARKGTLPAIESGWRKVSPAAVQLGGELYKRGTLMPLRKAGASAEAMLEALESRYREAARR